ncbi:MAG: hypothetical protein WKG00_38090 [Polyangiaceae bacterium]
MSAWDDEAEAQEMEGAGASAGCWKDNVLASMPRTGRWAAASRQRQGAVLIFVRGLDAPGRKAWSSKLGGLVAEAPRPEPLAGVTIPPRVPLPEPRKGRIYGNEYRSAWLGVAAGVPAGLEASTEEAGLELLVSRKDTLVRGALALSDRVVNEEQNERTFAEVERSFASALGEAGVSTEVAASGSVRTSLGNGRERVWRGVGTTVEMRMALVPICGGTGSVVLVTAYNDPLGQSVLDGWLESLHWINGRNVVACGYLDPK